MTGESTTSSSAGKVRHAAILRLIEEYPDRFNAIYAEERQKAGLDPVRDRSAAKTTRLTTKLEKLEAQASAVRKELGIPDPVPAPATEEAPA